MPKRKKPSRKKPSANPAALHSFIQQLVDFSQLNAQIESIDELVQSAMAAPTLERRMQLVEQILKLDNENVDALLMVMEASGRRGRERTEILHTIVDIANERLGTAAFKELVPHFWGFLETRPFMRALEALAHSYHDDGQLAEAAGVWSEMLTLNENDNQGVRYELLSTLLTLGRLDESRALLTRYKDDVGVPFAWGTLLERILSEDEPAATIALAKARSSNPHVEAFLTGSTEIPKTRPSMYKLGTIEEALCYIDDILPAWKAHPTALAWLSAHAKPTEKPSAAKTRKPDQST